MVNEILLCFQDYALSLLAGADLNFDNVAGGVELVVVKCTDVSGKSATGTYTVSLSDAVSTVTVKLPKVGH